MSITSLFGFFGYFWICHDFKLILSLNGVIIYAFGPYFNHLDGERKRGTPIYLQKNHSYNNIDNKDK